MSRVAAFFEHNILMKLPSNEQVEEVGAALEKIDPDVLARVIIDAGAGGEDDFAAKLLARQGRIPRDVELEF